MAARSGWGSECPPVFCEREGGWSESRSAGAFGGELGRGSEGYPPPPLRGGLLRSIQQSARNCGGGCV